jgi:hypothetical protein
MNRLLQAPIARHLGPVFDIVLNYACVVRASARPDLTHARRFRDDDS